MNALKGAALDDLVDLSLIQLINGSYPINAADFAGLKFDFDLNNNLRMRSIMLSRWQSQGLTDAQILAKKQQFTDLYNKYPLGVDFSTSGFPNFKPYRYKHNGVDVEIDIGALNPDPPIGVGGSNGSQLDMVAANNAMQQIYPNWTKPSGYTWHHIENSTKLELVSTDLHQAVRHSGGRSTYNF